MDLGMEDTPEINHLYSCSRWAGGDPDEVIRQYLAAESEEYKRLKSEVPVNEDIYYGPGDLQRIDVWGTVTDELFIFMHGGYWQEGDRKYLLSPATHTCGRIPYASVGYSMATAERPLSETVIDVIKAIARTLDEYPNVTKITLGGHSAGAHLAFKAASYLNKNSQIPKIKKLVLFAGVYNLDELVTCEIGRGIGLTKEEAKKNECRPEELNGQNLDILMLIGEKDSPRLVDQNKDMFQKLKNRHNVRFEVLKCHHFDLITGLQDKNSPQTQILLEFLGIN